MKKIKPERLKQGDTVAIVSLSWGGLGDENLIHKYYIAKERLEHDFKLKVITMPNALKGTEFIYNHPELRAKDLMDAFQDKNVKAIICAIGGTDSIRLLPYIDYEIIKNNPKIFMGYSDSTVSHFMMNKANLVSYYGPSIMSGIADYVKMFDYTKDALENMLFKDSSNLLIESSNKWSDDFIPWSEENINKKLKEKNEEHGYEVLQGQGKITGVLLGGCIDTFTCLVGTEIWPDLEEFKDKILLLETSDDKIEPSHLLQLLRNLGAQKIFDVVKGIVVGKPCQEKYYEEYKEIYLKVLKEFEKEELPVIYNINIGHSFPTGILPLGTEIEINFDNKAIKLIESATN